MSVSELLEKYFDQEVTEKERSLVEGHLKGCASCQDVLKSLNEVRNLIKAPAEEALWKEQFEWVWQRIKEEIRQEERFTLWESIQSWIHPSRFFQKNVWIPAAVAMDPWTDRGGNYPYRHIWILTLKGIYAEGLQLKTAKIGNKHWMNQVDC